jgi:hypothetical protein
MKRLFLIVTFLLMFLFSSSAVHASENNLHTITLEKGNSGYNIILGSDKLAKVSKKTPTDNELILILNGVTSSESVNALYRGTSNIDSLIIENMSSNRLKISVKADNIKNSTIIMEPLVGEPTIVAESVPIDKILWGMFVLALCAVICKISKDMSEEDEKNLIRKSMKDREIELYKRYTATLPDMSVNKDFRMKKMLKKIDRKIDERLSASIR